MAVASVVFSLLQFSWMVVSFTGLNDATTKKQHSLLMVVLPMPSNAAITNIKSLHGILSVLLPSLSGLVVSPLFFSISWTWLVCSGKIFHVIDHMNLFLILELNLTLKSVVWTSRNMVNQHTQQQLMVTDGILKEISTCPVSIDCNSSVTVMLVTTFCWRLLMTAWECGRDSKICCLQHPSPTSMQSHLTFFRDVNTLFQMFAMVVTKDVAISKLWPIQIKLIVGMERHIPKVV